MSDVVRPGALSNIMSRDGAHARPPGSSSCVKMTGAKQQTGNAHVRHDQVELGSPASKSTGGLRHVGSVAACGRSDYAA
jgi:hypothetical protein